MGESGKVLGPPAGHLARLKGPLGHPQFFEDILVEDRGEITGRGLQLALVVRQQRHRLALEDLGNLLHRRLQNLVDPPGAGELPAQGHAWRRSGAPANGRPRPAAESGWPDG